MHFDAKSRRGREDARAGPECETLSTLDIEEDEIWAPERFRQSVEEEPARNEKGSGLNVTKLRRKVFDRQSFCH